MRFLFLLLLSFNAMATVCAPLNLVTEENSPFKKIPVYDQDGIGICYAYAAAQMMDYHIIKNGGERSVHPLWAALKFSDHQQTNELSGGMSYYAVEEILKQGNCQYDNIEKSLSTWAKKANVKEIEVVNLIEILAPKLEALKNFKGSFRLERDEVDAVIKEAIQEHEPYCSPNSTWDKIYPELRAIGVMSSPKLLSKLVLPVCNKNLKKYDVPPPRWYPVTKDEDLTTNLKFKLDGIKAPVSITFCATVLTDPEHDGINRATGTGSEETYTEDCGHHESIVVGKKTVNGSCHYLVRNTWGPGFDETTTKWKCLCRKRGTQEFVDDCTEATHNNGQYLVEGCWISEDALGKNTLGLTWLEHPK
jgi:hypothetical protein